MQNLNWSFFNLLELPHNLLDIDANGAGPQVTGRINRRHVQFLGTDNHQEPNRQRGWTKRGMTKQEFAYAAAVIHSGRVGWEHYSIFRPWLHEPGLTSNDIPENDDRKDILFNFGLAVFEIVNVNFGGVGTRPHRQASLWIVLLNAANKLDTIGIDRVRHDWSPLIECSLCL